MRVRSALYGMLLGILIPTLASGQAVLLPNAKQQYLDDSADPVASGSVTYYVPNTSTKKTVWQDAEEATPQSNPVLLDAAGRPQPDGQTFGAGCYRQVVKDVNSITIWDAVTCSPGSGGGGGGGDAGEGILVGAIIAWAATTPVPAKYLFANGQAVNRVSYAALFSVLTYNPTIICNSGTPTVTVATEISDYVPIGAPVEFSCFPSGTTVSAKTTGQLTLSNNATASTSVAGYIFPWGNGNGTTTFNVPDLRGRVIAGADNNGGTAASRLTTAFYGSNPDAMGAAGGAQSTPTTLITANLPPYTPTGTVSGTVSITDPGHTHVISTTAALAGINNNSGGGGGIFSAMSTPINDVSSSTTGITASMAATVAMNAQGGVSTPLAVNVIQPTLTTKYIIKAFPDDNLVTGITVGITTVSNGGNTNIIYNNNGIVGEYALSTANQYNCATAGTLVQPSVVYQAETVTAYAATTVFNFCTFKNTSVTLTGNITTQTFTNVVAGKAGMITFIQDGTGSRTTVWNSVLKFTGGVTPTLTATAGAVDILTYACRSATFCGASLLTDVK